MDLDLKNPKTRRTAAIALAVVVVLIILVIILGGSASSFDCNAGGKCPAGQVCQSDGSCGACAFDWKGGCSTDGPANFQRYVGAWPGNRWGRDPAAPVQTRWAENPLASYVVDSADECEKDCASDPQGCSGFSLNSNDPDNLHCALWPLPGANGLVQPASGGDPSAMMYGFRPDGPPNPLAACPDSNYPPQGSSAQGEKGIPPGCWASSVTPGYTVYQGAQHIQTGTKLWNNGTISDAKTCAAKCDAWDGCAYWQIGYSMGNDTGSGGCGLFDDTVESVPVPLDNPSGIQGYVGVAQS